ncbi:MAG: hypothetical protein A3K19_24940 [Lentisphaerae bacterium RIFOXYB12_FULL_65_16]|nr:MAG: hypothetical protein A3K18_24870 [Lentisphaerae bacterium RIFOXYA12_64_32]OGV90717.1 MAG: hypothetical protein A3K19_24940 [Lentisphaerae bacterium RIFOXYB12_FULL_65_16]
MSKQYYRDQIDNKKKAIYHARDAIARLRATKKLENQHIAMSIKNTKSRDLKTSYRTRRINSNHSFDLQIASRRNEIARLMKEKASLMASMRREKR